MAQLRGRQEDSEAGFISAVSLAIRQARREKERLIFRFACGGTQIPTYRLGAAELDVKTV